MPYQITYPSQTAVSVALSTDTASDAVRLARGLVEQGHAPTIEKDGQQFTLEDLDRIVAKAKLGEGSGS